ncbi:DUF3306 domain-containing protein [Massilia sp. TW-1]|uniref:DUF3306 domain-containing protein n=1 Tax=Telluria antibiotica TaxID=2717319 RepID=A0ABX0PCT4_9BURK|nr:DUF3306 domain-containing protein [Telluria antibiotica]NIA55163.1 DUF3306 domain-containing protein [Telluria antibiotica]
MTGATLADEGFLRRWARRKTEVRTGTAPIPEEPASAAVPALADAAAAAPVPLPTMDDVARLTHDSDFSAFVARGVDAAVRRTALKTLFADPHFNTIDGLDVYMGDYTAPSPMSEAMLASLAHAKQVLRRAVDVATDDPDPPPGDPPDAT